ncbi:hypothetical protein GGR56DRAFT_698344 [Xylariaceae sp. FL0804]|nr:hypothetical protein GGR56DRAFT_698344 [Xylariaceae sp. FL0804]
MPVIQELEKLMQNEPEIEDVLAAATAHMNDAHPPLTDKQLEDRLPPRPNPNSDDAEEASTSIAWNNDPMKKHLLAGSNRSLAMLWRHTLRFMDIFVEELIGPRFDLEYDNEANKRITVGGQSVHHPNWSQGFCEKLHELVSHPTWMGQPGPLAVALQYVVKCRTNDQRRSRWPRENYTTDMFVGELQNVHETFQDGTKTVAELHDEAVRRLGTIPSPVSRLFRCIEDRVLDVDVEPLRGNPASPPAYLVATLDLTRLIQALDDQVDAYGLPLHRRTATTAMMVTAAKHSYDLPKTNGLEMCRERVLLALRRDKLRARRMGLRHPSHQAPPQQPPPSRPPQQRKKGPTLLPRSTVSSTPAPGRTSLLDLYPTRESSASGLSLTNDGPSGHNSIRRVATPARVRHALDTADDDQDFWGGADDAGDLDMADPEDERSDVDMATDDNQLAIEIPSNNSVESQDNDSDESSRSPLPVPAAFAYKAFQVARSNNEIRRLQLVTEPL